MTSDETLQRIDAGTGNAGLAPGAARHRHEAPLELVQDLVEVHVPRDGRVAVVSDLHLTGTMTDASRGCTEELVRVLSAWSGPAVLVIAGDGFEQLHEPVAPIEDILDAHGEWVQAVRAFAAADDHAVIVLAGNHDGNIAWDEHVATTLHERLGATHLALAADLVLDTGEGERRVHVVHGNQNDEYNAFADPRSPLDTPTGHHIVRQVLPQLDRVVRPGGLLDGLYWLSEPMLAGEMVGSRLLYRRIGHRAWLLMVPFLAAIVLRALAFLPGIDVIRDNVDVWVIGFCVTVLLFLGLAIGVATLTLLAVHHVLANTEVGQRAGVGAHNAPAREHAARVIELGYAGMVSGHTHQPELTVVGDGFYANSGCGVEVLGPRPARLGLPRPFTSVLRLARVELIAAEKLEVRLVVADVPVPVATFLERVVMKPDRDTPTVPTVTASLPGGSTWPVDPTSLGQFARTRRTRRQAAGLLLAMAGLDLASSILGPSLRPFAVFADRIPDDVPRAAGVLVLLGAVAFVGLARGVRRGYRQTWAAAIVLLVATSLVLIGNGINIEQAVFNVGLAVWLLVKQRYFAVLVTGRRRWLLWAAALTIAAVGLATTITLQLDDGTEDRLIGLAVALVIALVLLVFLMARPPNEERMRTGQSRTDAESRAREIVDRLGGDTFDHAAVRDDKALLFAGDGVVSYRVIDGRMVVSPDPICGVDDRTSVWASAMDHADTHGWRLTVLAANASWLSTYHASGLHDVYLGDEAIVDCSRHVADSRSGDAVDQACVAARAKGYSVSMLDATEIDDGLRARLDRLATGAEIGAPGHGFATSMGRVARPEDDGVLLALCHASVDGDTGADGGGDGGCDGRDDLVAFHQHVPAHAIGGYMLDLAATAHLGADAEIVSHLLLDGALRWMERHDAKALSLGLAASGGLNYGEARTGHLPLERRVLAQFADGDELQRRRRVDAAYAPVWRPRYVVTDSMRSAWAENHPGREPERAAEPTS